MLSRENIYIVIIYYILCLTTFDPFCNDVPHLCEIDPDINYIGEENTMKCNQYYAIHNFNMNYTNDNKLSLFLLNLRSLPDHFREMVTYL